MRLREACQRASELNREQQANGTRTRFVVVANPVGSCGGDYQVVARQVRSGPPRTAGH
jgi:hypothetical protein